MASIYTDEAREARYGKLRIKRNRCEKWLGWIMWAILLIGALSLIPGFVDGLLGGLFRGELFTFFGFLFSVVNFCAAVYAVYAKKWQHTIAAIVLIAVLGAITASINYKMAASTFNIIPLIPTFFIDRVWAELEKEEGFPLFDISYAEREERRRNMEKLTEARALRAGYRVAQTEQTSDMSDLLDSGRDAPVMAAHPRGYHDRYQDSQQITEPFQGIRSGVMDTLEDIGGDVQPAAHPKPPAAVSSSVLASLEAMDSTPAVPGRQPDVPAAFGQTTLGEIGRPEPEELYDRSADDEINAALRTMNGDRKIPQN